MNSAAWEECAWVCPMCRTRQTDALCRPCRAPGCPEAIPGMAASREAGGREPGELASRPVGGPLAPSAAGLLAMSPPGTFVGEMARAALERGFTSAPPPPGTFAALGAAAKTAQAPAGAAPPLRGSAGGRSARYCWGCGMKGHLYALCPLAASQEGGGELLAGGLAGAATAGASALNPAEDVRRAAAQDLGSQPAEQALVPRTPALPQEVRVSHAQAAAKKAATELKAAREVSKAAMASLEAAQTAARVAMLAAQAAEDLLTMAEADLSAAKQELESVHLMGHAKLNEILGSLADTATRLGTAGAEEAAAGEHGACSKASTAAVRRFKKVLRREMELSRNQAEAAGPLAPRAAGHPYHTDGDMDGEGENTRTAKRMRLFGEVVELAGSWIWPPAPPPGPSRGPP